MSLVLEELEECLPDKDNNVEETIIENELQHLINRFVEDLPLKYRNIFVRRYFLLIPSRKYLLCMACQRTMLWLF